MESLQTKTTEDLAMDLAELKIKESEPYLSEARKEQIRKQMAYISFELTERAKDEISG